MTMWMVRAGRRASLLRNVPDFFDRGLVAIGWYAVGDLNAFASYSEMLAATHRTLPNATVSKLNTDARNLWRFSREIQIGDYVVTYNPRTRYYAVGQMGGYEWRDPVFEPHETEDDTYANMRQVRWIAVPGILRDDLNDETQQALTSDLTVFRLSPEIEQEVWRVVNG